MFKKKYITVVFIIVSLFAACSEEKSSYVLEGLSPDVNLIIAGSISANGIYGAINLQYLKPDQSSDVKYYIPIQYDGRSNFFIFIKSNEMKKTKDILKKILTRIPGFKMDKKIYFRAQNNLKEVMDQEIISVVLEKRKNRFQWLQWNTKKEVLQSESGSYRSSFPFLMTSEGYTFPGLKYHSIHFLGFSNLNESFQFFSNGIYHKNTDVEKEKIYHLQKVDFSSLIKDFVY